MCAPPIISRVAVVNAIYVSILSQTTPSIVLSLKTKNFFLNMPQFYKNGAKEYHAVPASKNTECHLRKPCSAGSGVTITDFLPGCLEGNPPAIAAPICAVPNRKQQGIPSSADKLKKTPRRHRHRVIHAWCFSAIFSPRALCNSLNNCSITQ